MTEFKIEDGIPIKDNRGVHSKFPLARMEVGQSFFAPAEVKRQALQNAAHNFSKTSGKKFTCAKVDGGHRVWRVS